MPANSRWDLIQRL